MGFSVASWSFYYLSMALSLLMLCFISPSQVHSLALCAGMARSAALVCFVEEGNVYHGKVVHVSFFLKKISGRIKHFGKDKWF